MKKDTENIKSELVVTKLVDQFSVIVEDKRDHTLQQMNYFSSDGWPSERTLLDFYERFTKRKDAVELVEVRRDSRGYVPVEKLENLLRTQGESKN